MKITIVTVCLNAEKTIKGTIESVLGQTYLDIEYIIADGQSKDATITIIKQYINDRRVRFLSEKDKGLYNAMNRALKHSTGNYVLFMNSGDTFCDDKVVEDIASYLTEDIVYGNAIRVYSDTQTRETYQGRFKLISMLLMGKMMCHQSMFVRREIMCQYEFDEQYRICADYDFVVRAIKNKCSMKYIDRDICFSECAEGISSQSDNLNFMRMEDDKSLKSHMPVLFYLVFVPKRFYRWFHDGVKKKMKLYKKD